MGASKSSLPKSNWSFVRRDDTIDVYQNQFGILAQKHIIMNDPRLNEEEEINAYLYRCNSTKPIVKAYRVDYQNGEDFCSHYKNISVYIEYIPFRLIDTLNLTHQQGLYVLSQSLLGFHELYGHLGAFEVDHTLIGFNKDGQVRVWHNINFAKNHLESGNLILMSTKNPNDFDKRLVSKQQQQMVQDIWAAVDHHAQFTQRFRKQVSIEQQLNFYNLKEIVDEEIRRLPYVPPRLKFQDKNGVIQSSRGLLNSSSHSKTSIYNLTVNNRAWT